MVADVSLCLSLSRTDSMAAEERSRRLKATGTKGRRHCESTYNEVTHAFTRGFSFPLSDPRDREMALSSLLFSELFVGA